MKGLYGFDIIDLRYDTYTKEITSVTQLIFVSVVFKLKSKSRCT